MSKKSGFVAGAAILTLSGLLVKIIGAFYRIPLTNIIGTEGIGLYQVGYPIYSYLLVASTSGLPAAISRQVAEKLAKNDPRGARNVFHVSLKIMAVLGLVGALVMFFGARILATLIGDAQGELAIRAIAPALLVVALLSAFRGYFQGMQHMVPTAATQVVEQLGKLAIGLYLAKAWLPMGPAYAAAGALVGVTLSEVAALVLMLGIYARKRKGLAADAPHLPLDSFAKTGKQLAAIAIPVTIGASIMPLVGFIDTMMVINRLKDIGYSVLEARAMFGLLTGVVNTLINMPSVFSVALAISMVPSVSAARAQGDEALERKLVGGGVKLAILIGLPAAIGLGMLALPAVNMLYPRLDPGEPELAARLVQAMAASIFFLALVQTTTGALQGVGRAGIPVRSLALGAGLKVVVSFFLLAIPSINIVGAPVGTVLCYVLASGLNLIYLRKEIGMRLNWIDTLIKPAVAALAMAAAVWGAQALLPRVSSSNLVQVLGAIAAGGVVYLLALLAMGAITQEELDMLPGGNRIARVLGKKTRK